MHDNRKLVAIVGKCAASTGDRHQACLESPNVARLDFTLLVSVSRSYFRYWVQQFGHAGERLVSGACVGRRPVVQEDGVVQVARTAVV